MTTLKTFIGRHLVLTYFVLTFIISWSGVLMIIGPGGIPGTSAQIARLFPLSIVTMLAGPSIAAILLTGLVEGWAGLRVYLAQLRQWRVDARWYAVALLTVPILIAPILFALSLISPVYLPGIATADDKIALLLTGIAVGLAAGFFEELGWTGFAVPRLRSTYAILTTGLIVGFLWGLWHFLVTFWGSGDAAGVLSQDLLLPPLLFYVGVLPVYRVLMVWVYDRSASLPVAMLMHASLTANTLFMLLPAAIGVPLSAYYLILTAVMWGVVAAVAIFNGGHLSRQRLDPAMHAASG
jgi:hypothetical protein